MLALILVLSLAIGGAYAAAAGWRRLPDTWHTEVARTVRDVRLRSGAYSLKLVMEHMVDEMLASVLPSVTKSYVPNEMTFGMHPRDASRWGGYFDKLADELRAVVLLEVRRRSDLHLGDAGLRVVVRRDAAGEPGRPSFSARMREAVAATETATTATAELDEDRSVAVAVGGTAAAGGAWRLRTVGRPDVPIRDVLTIGRGSEANVQIDDRNVSRAHARISLLGDRVTIVDLDSMNGTWVNGARVDMAMLDPGDRIHVGGEVAMSVDREPSGD